MSLWEHPLPIVLLSPEHQLVCERHLEDASLQLCWRSFTLRPKGLLSPALWWAFWAPMWKPSWWTFSERCDAKNTHMRTPSNSHLNKILPDLVYLYCLVKELIVDVCVVFPVVLQNLFKNLKNYDSFETHLVKYYIYLLVKYYKAIRPIRPHIYLHTPNCMQL